MADNNYRFGFLEAEFWAVKTDPKKARRLLRRFPSYLNIQHPPKLYHYTTSEALVGIVKSRGFWLTHCAYMNDAVEIVHGAAIAQEMLDKLSTKARYNYGKDILTRVAQELNDASLPNQFVACFTSEHDSLEQWRAYCPSGGVNIELSLNQGTYGGRLGAGPRMMFRRVVYNDLDKRGVILIYAHRYLSELKKDIEFYRERGLSDTLREDLFDQYVQSLASAIKHRLPAFKHAAFKSESEYRLIVSEQEIDRFLNVHERVQNGKIIPYLKTNEWFESKKPPEVLSTPTLSISSVIVGPQKDRQLVIKSISDYMHRNGYPDINVRPSSAPYRTN